MKAPVQHPRTCVSRDCVSRATAPKVPKYLEAVGEDAKPTVLWSDEMEWAGYFCKSRRMVKGAGGILQEQEDIYRSGRIFIRAGGYL